MRNHYYRMLILCVVVLCLSCGTIPNYLYPNGPKYTGQYALQQKPAKATITVVSYNIKFAKKIPEAIDDLSEIDVLKDADIILLQEMDPGGTEAIARALRYNYVYYPASVHKTGKDFGNAILSRWPINSPRKIILPHESMNKQRRIAVEGTIDMAGTDIMVYSVHTETAKMSREKRIDQTDHLVQNIPTAAVAKYVVVGGDFNTWTERGSVEATDRVFTTKNLERATKEIGATASFIFKFDHIYTRNMTVTAKNKSEEATASDHKPIWVKLTFN